MYEQSLRETHSGTRAGILNCGQFCPYKTFLGVRTRVRQGCYQIFYNAQNSPLLHKIYPVQIAAIISKQGWDEGRGSSRMRVIN